MRQTVLTERGRTLLHLAMVLNGLFGFILTMGIVGGFDYADASGNYSTEPSFWAFGLLLAPITLGYLLHRIDKAYNRN